MLPVRLGGDGRSIRNKRGNVLVAFSVLNLGHRIHRDKHTHTLAIIDGEEDHDTLINGLASLRTEIRQSQANGIFDSNGNHHKV